MKNNLTAQLIFRSAYLMLAVLALLVSMGLFNIGSGTIGLNFNPLFFNDYFNWAIIMSICATVFAIIDNVRSAQAGKTHSFSDKYPLLKFCTASSMLFCFLLGTFFISRVGNNAMTDAAATDYGVVFPGFLTPAFWTDLSAFLPRFVVPLAYLAGFIIFEERLKSRGMYATLGILPPTIFYFFSFFLSLIISAAYGGAQALVDAGIYGIVYPYFYCDSAFTYTGWWWILIWPTIFGVSLMLINNTIYYITRTVKDENGKRKLYKKLKVDEDKMRDCIHYFKVKLAAKKAAKQNADGGDNSGENGNNP